MDLVAIYQDILAKIAGAQADAAGKICLVAVSKKVVVAKMRELYHLGQRDFGESRWQEAQQKIEQLPNDVRWHFIGRLQSNKLGKIVANFDFIHSVASADYAHKIDEHALELGKPIKFFAQVNVAEDGIKAGFSMAELEANFTSLLQLKQAELVGLMMIPPIADEEKTAGYFASLANFAQKLAAQHQLPPLHLSMGMSGDFELALKNGADFVRIGSSLFGTR